MSRGGMAGGSKPFQGQDILAVILICAILVSGLFIIHQSNVRANTYTQLTDLRLEQDRELSEYTRLLIEKESLSSYQLVLSQAETLGMTHPEQIHLIETSEDRER